MLAEFPRKQQAIACVYVSLRFPSDMPHMGSHDNWRATGEGSIVPGRSKWGKEEGKDPPTYGVTPENSKKSTMQIRITLLRHPPNRRRNHPHTYTRFYCKNEIRQGRICDKNKRASKEEFFYRFALWLRWCLRPFRRRVPNRNIGRIPKLRYVIY